MPFRETLSRNAKLSIQLSLIALAMVIGMSLFEIAKSILHPDITLWQSHIITIIFSTVTATAVSFFMLSREIDLNSKLHTKVVESELLRNELEKTVGQLKSTLSEVKTLNKLLPICGYCKKIRDDKGYWNQLESYISKHAEVDFSHGICPECLKKVYDELPSESDSL